MKAMNIAIFLAVLVLINPAFATGDNGMIRVRLLSLSTGEVMTADEGGIFNLTVNDSLTLFYNEDSRYQGDNPINWSIASTPNGLTILDKGKDFLSQGSAKIVINKAGNYTLKVTGSAGNGKSETKTFNISANGVEIASEQTNEQATNLSEIVNEQAINEINTTQILLNQQNKETDQACSNKDKSTGINTLLSFMVIGGYVYYKRRSYYGK